MQRFSSRVKLLASRGIAANMDVASSRFLVAFWKLEKGERNEQAQVLFSNERVFDANAG